MLFSSCVNGQSAAQAVCKLPAAGGQNKPYQPKQMQTLRNYINDARQSILENKLLTVARVLGISVGMGTLVLFLMLLSNPVRFGASKENSCIKRDEPKVEISITPIIISAINSTIGQKSAN